MIKQLSRRLLRAVRRGLGVEQVYRELSDLEQRLAYGSTSRLNQLLLVHHYREAASRNQTARDFADVEFRAFSQNGEDGILLYIFSLLGMGRRRTLEICASNGIQCNSANLVINHGWEALLFDGNKDLIEQGKSFYARHPDTFSSPPKFALAWITKDNINTLVRDNGFEGEIDLLSLDLDGNDYWIWEALDVVRPRVVVAEIQCIWGADRSVTVPYDPQFRTPYVDGFAIYSGASLPAFIKLGERKGYRFVGVQRLGFNAFFVRNDLGLDTLPTADPATCLDVPFVRWAKRELLPRVHDKRWIEI